MTVMISQHHASRAPVQKLSHRAYLFRPLPGASDHGTKHGHDPALIIIFGWMNGTPQGPLAKYISQYQSLFPSSSILLVTCTFAGMTLPWLGLREARAVVTAANTILAQDTQARGELPTKTSDKEGQARPHAKPRLLLHVFSNAGSTMLHHLYRAYAEQAHLARGSSSPTPAATESTDSDTLPRHVTIFDSCPAPGPFTYQIMLQVILDSAAGPSTVVRRLVLTPIAYIYYVALVWILVMITKVLRLPNHVGDLAPRAHNDPKRVGEEVIRVYMYGNADRITPWTGVERHAREAAARGFNVQREVFERSEHVAHARIHPDRYWNVIRQSWEDAVGL